jgi:hypothetical protein
VQIPDFPYAGLAMRQVCRHRRCGTGISETRVDSFSDARKIDLLPYSRRLVRVTGGLFNMVRNTNATRLQRRRPQGRWLQGHAGDCVARAIAIASGSGGKVESLLSGLP